MRQSQYELICLGVGKGNTHVLHRQCSSSFAIRNNATGECVLLLDLGLGVMDSFQQHFPNQTSIQNVYISHNHSDHSGELPIFLATSFNQKTQFFCHPSVQQILFDHRVAELRSSSSFSKYVKKEKWFSCEEGKIVEVNEDFSIQVVKSQHSETCYGLLVYCRGKPCFSFTADSGFNEEYFSTLWNFAPVVLIDARAEGTYEHAGFDEVESFVLRQPETKKVLVYHYGLPSEIPIFPSSKLRAVAPGEAVALINSS